MLSVCPLYWGHPKSLLFCISNSPVWFWSHRIPNQPPAPLFRTNFPLKTGRCNWNTAKGRTCYTESTRESSHWVTPCCVIRTPFRNLQHQLLSVQSSPCCSAESPASAQPVLAWTKAKQRELCCLQLQALSACPHLNLTLLAQTIEWRVLHMQKRINTLHCFWN